MCVTWLMSHRLVINSKVQIKWFECAAFVKFKGWYCACICVSVCVWVNELFLLKQMGLPVDHNFSCVSKKLFKGAKKCSQGLGNGLPLWVCGCACKGECVWPVFVIMNSPPPIPESPAVLSVCVCLNFCMCPEILISHIFGDNLNFGAQIKRRRRYIELREWERRQVF